jgi:hypothetical protein
MTTPALIQAAKLEWADEAPLRAPFPSTPYWVENYSWHVYDENQCVGVFVHMGRWWRNPRLWRHEVTVLLPDGVQLVSRAFAAGNEHSGPAAALLRKNVIEPGHSWRLAFSGPAQRSSFGEMSAGSLRDSFPENVDFELVFHGAGPVAMFPTTHDETWGRFHYEQHGGMSGQIVVAEREFVLEDAFAYRDHSRGPRDLSHHLGHNWIQGRLPDGTGFAVYQVWQTANGVESLALDRAFLMRADEIRNVPVLEAPPLTKSHDLTPGEFRVVLGGPDGRIAVNGEIVDTIPASLQPPFDWIHGFADNAQLFSISQPSRLRIDGAATSGWCERSYRVPCP